MSASAEGDTNRGMARKALGLAMMVDAAMQAMDAAGLMSTIADRDLRNQSLFAAHLVVGTALMFSGRTTFSSAMHRTTPVLVLVAALVLSVIEATWFDWTGTAARAAYTAVALVVLVRSTTLPITTPDSSS